MKVGNGIRAREGGWTFKNAKVARAFDDHVALSVPDYDTMQGLVARLSTYFVREDGVVVDFGCATGRTLLDVYRANAARRPRLVGVDESAQMCERARARLATARVGGEIVTANFTTIRPPNDSCLLIAIYALQFTTFAKRLAMLQSCRESVETGTALVVVEKTVADEALFAIPFNDAHHDEKLVTFSAAEVVDKARSLRGVLRPMTTGDNERMLTSAGWTPQRFWQHLAFTGWVCLAR
jgi:trans-aconitate methyltransferase